jgi:tRNA pseudouridine38-40 synthase
MLSVDRIRTIRRRSVTIVRVKATRRAVWVWYRGDHFRGFQSQNEGGSVQQTIASALKSLGVERPVMAAGRTDRGVHARMQVLNVRVPPEVSDEELFTALQEARPGSLGAVSVKPHADSFHAQWSAIAREYRFRFAIGPDVDARWTPFAWRVRGHPRFPGSEPDRERMEKAIRHFRGAHDFFAFHEKSSIRKLRRIDEATLHEVVRGVLELRLVGDSFGRHQVRYLAGATALVGAGIVDGDSLRRALLGDADFPGVKAPAGALVLWDVHYPPEIDPFNGEERSEPRGIPPEPPFVPPTG